MDRSSFNRVESTHDKEKRLAFKAKLASKIDSADQVQTPEVFGDSSYSPVGQNVWHPDFGLCQIHMIDEKNNSIVLRVHNQDRELDLVLSQVRSKLIPADQAPEHVPVKPLVREPLAKRVPAYTAPVHGVFVTLPTVFNLWQRKDQFLFLTQNQKLTTTEAEDVFSVLSGKAPLFSEVKVEWVNPTPTDKRPELAGELIPEPNSPFMVGQKVWHLDLGAGTVLSVDSKNIVLELTNKEIVELVLSYAQPRLSLTETVTLDHASTYYAAPKVVKTVKADENVTHSVTLPQAFNSWDAKRQHMFLCSENHLTTDEAAEVLSRMAGNKPLTKLQFEITWDDSAYNATVEAASKKAKKTPRPVVKPQPLMVGMAGRSVEEVDVVEKVAVTKLSLTLPEVFKTWSGADQYVFLSKTLSITPDDSQDIVSICRGMKPFGSTQFEISWDSSNNLKDFEFPTRIVEQVDVVKKEVAAVKLSVSLPEAFKSWTASDQFFFLSRTKHLTANEANDVIDLIHGKSASSKNVLFEIRWDG